MRRALGRLLGVVFTLVLVSLIAVAALSELTVALGARGALRLPIYFNPKPANVHDLTERVIARIASSDASEAAAAERELARLGGAALPHILPRLDELSPKARRRVALALAPVGRRMLLTTKLGELEDGERAVSFWGAFWQDHEFDFRPQVRRRLVARIAEHASPHAHDEIVRLDTYALPELIGALGRIRGAYDIARARRLTLLLSHMTGHGPVIDARASIAEARSGTRVWRRFMVEEGADFTTLDGPTRLVAMFAQSVYGHWLGRFFGVVRIGQERQPAFGIPPDAALGSLTRYLGALALSLALAAAWAHAEARARLGLARASRLVALALVATPAVFIASAFATSKGELVRSLLAVLVSAVLTSAVISRVELASTSARKFDGPRRRSDVVAGILRAAPSALPWFVTSLFGLELALELDGVARSVLNGLRRSDIRAGMTLALSLSVLAAGLAALADATTRPTFLHARKPSLVDVGSPVRRPWFIAVLLSGCLLASFALLGPFAEQELGTAPIPGVTARVPGWFEVTHGARALLGYGTVALVIALLIGIVFGMLAARGRGALDTLLIRSTELSAALPTALWTAAITQALSAGLLAALAIGVLRGIDIAWMLRSELRSTTPSDDPSHIPYATYFRQQVRPALPPALALLALTPAWWLAQGTLGDLLELTAVPGARGWDALLGTRLGSPLPSIVAFALILSLVVALHGFVTAMPRRVGAFRASSIPPPPPSERVSSSMSRPLSESSSAELPRR